jgi:acetyl esterase/lipase
MSFLIRAIIQNNWRRAKKKDDARIASQTPTPGVAEDRDIRYAEDDNRMHLLDIYYPENTSGLLPTIIDIHGGGWMYGDKELNKYYNLSLAARGFAVVNMSYRLLPNTDLQGQVRDIFAAFRWLENNGPKYHCDTNRVFLTGDSAGGHLTGLAVCILLSRELQNLYGVPPAGFRIRAAAISHGVCNLQGKPLSGFNIIDREMFRLWFGKKPEENPLYGKSCFEDTAQGLSLPPIMLISSEPDHYHYQSLALETYLKKRGAPCTTKFWKREHGAKLGHVFHILYPQWKESVETNREMLSFFSGS